MTKLSALSVFFPAYNEENNIKNTLDKALVVLPKFADRFEVIVVDDGSSDKTTTIVKNISQKHHEVRLISHKLNKGYGEALKTGLYSAKYPFIAFTDSDGQFDIKELAKFIEKINQYDLVVGFRLKRADKGLRFINAKAWGFLMHFLFSIKVKDIDCGFKLLTKKVIDSIPKLESSGALISSELLVKAKKANFLIYEIGVNHYPRTQGSQTGANFKVILRAFWELFKLYRRLR